MRRVQSRPFRDHFKIPQDELDRSLSAWKPSLFYRRREFFHPFILAAVLLGFGIVLSIGYRAAQVFTLSYLLFLAALYFHIRNVAHGLFIRRQVPKRVIEKNGLKVRYEIRNTSHFSAHDLLIRDSFSGSLSGEKSIGVDETVGPLSYHAVEGRFFCDGGMGPHRLGPLSVLVSDPLGIFEFSVTEDQLEAVEVLPEHISVEHFKIPHSTESAISGTQEGKSQGQSTNFLGVREYRAGDPIRQIHWKLSAKHQELVVKEFENIVNTELTICLDMDQRNHIGYKSSSTWEYTKDIAISIIREKGPQVGRLQFLSQNLMIPFGSGHEHLESIVQKISALRPVNAMRARHLLEDAWLNSPYGSGLLYISPIYQNDPSHISSLLESLSSKAVRVSCVYVPAASFTEFLPALTEVKGRIAEKNADCLEILSTLLKLNSGLKIVTHVVEPGQSIARSLALPRVTS